MAINYKDIIHPEDESALRQFENTAGVKMLAEKIMSAGVEHLCHNLCMADCLKLGPQQMPEIYERLLPIVQKFSIPEPDLFLSLTPKLSVETFGDKKPFIVITKNLVTSLSKEELDFVLARECGHILCRHSPYLTVLHILGTLKDSTEDISSSIPMMSLLTGAVLKTAYFAANYWSIRAEYSADRAGMIYAGNENVCQKALLRLWLGSLADNVNLDACIEQHMQIESKNSESSWNKVLNMLLVDGRTKPFATTQLAEIRKWARSAQYRTVLDNLDKPACISPTCPNCKSDIDETWKFCRNCGAKL